MVYILLADGFEEVEALTPIDLLRRANISVMPVGVTGKNVKGGQGIEIVCEKTIDEIDFQDAEMLILPGGGIGTQNLYANEKVRNAVTFCYQSDKYIAAICAAPSIILGGMGLLKGKKATCYPGMEDGMTDALSVDANSVIDGKIITGRGVGGALDFACDLIKVLQDETQAQKIASEVVHYARKS